MKWPFSSKSAPVAAVPMPAPRAHVVSQTGTPGVTRKAAQNSALRRSTGGRVKGGMWVVYSDTVFKSRVGILTALSDQDVATVMLVHEDGTNFMEVRDMAANLKQAKYHDIPEARKPNLAAATHLGYL